MNGQQDNSLLRPQFHQQSNHQYSQHQHSIKNFLQNLDIDAQGRKKMGRKVIDWTSSCVLYVEVLSLCSVKFCVMFVLNKFIFLNTIIYNTNIKFKSTTVVLRAWQFNSELASFQLLSK